MSPQPAAVQRLPGAPDLLALHRAAPARYPFLLESGGEGGHGARWDILFAFPGERLVLDADGGISGPHRGSGFLDSLDQWFAADRAAALPARFPFNGGWFLYLGYELAAEIEPRLRLLRDARLPTAVAVRCPVAVLREHESGGTWVVAEPGHEAALPRVVSDAAAAIPVAPRHAVLASGFTEDDDGRYLECVAEARRYIRDGDVFQANLSRAWRGRLTDPVDPAALHALLRDANPAPFAGLARFPVFAVVSSSPERLVEVRGTRVQTRPIAGTRPRAADPDRDRALVAELVANPKERAEHVMLIDLERNDLSRVCLPGSVAVSEMMVVESYATVHHIVSNVVGVRRPDATPGQVIRAVFPGGTITGCPKVRCMEIIAELERGPRGPYTGSIGYLDRAGDLDLNILIRSALVVGDALELRAGAGIVHESVPERELEETRHKARGLTRAWIPGGA